MSSVQEALKAREERKKREQEENKAKYEAKRNKVNSALDNYKKRKQSSSQSATSDIAKRINTEIEAIKKVSELSWGSGSLGSALESTRESRLNIENLQRELESYKSYIDEDTYTNLSSVISKLSESYDSYLSVAEIRDKFDSEDSYNKWYEKQSRKSEIESVKDHEDFEQYSQVGASIKNPTPNEAEPDVTIFGWKIGEKYPGNVVTYSRDNADALGFGEANGGGSEVGGKYLYTLMTDEEVNIYNYYLGKGDKETADEYLEYMEDILTQRQGGALAKRIEDQGKLSEVFFSYGLD